MRLEARRAIEKAKSDGDCVEGKAEKRVCAHERIEEAGEGEGGRG